jgi:hypothetical protein
MTKVVSSSAVWKAQGISVLMAGPRKKIDDKELIAVILDMCDVGWKKNEMKPAEVELFGRCDGRLVLKLE